MHPFATNQQWIEIYNRLSVAIPEAAAAGLKLVFGKMKVITEGTGTTHQLTSIPLQRGFKNPQGMDFGSSPAGFSFSTQVRRSLINRNTS